MSGGKGPRARRVASIGVGIAVLSLSLWYIWTSFRWADIIEILRRADLSWVLIGGGLTILAQWLVRTWRWMLILKKLHVEVRFLDLYLCQAVSQSLSIVTPVQSGEMAKVEWLKRRGVMDRLPGYGSFIMERAIDLLVLVVLAAISGALVAEHASSVQWLFIFFIILVLAGVAGLFGIKNREWPARAGRLLSPFQACTRDPKLFAWLLILTVGSWVLVGLGWLFCLQSVSLDLGIIPALALVFVMTIVNVLSFIPGAVGVSEAGIAEFLIRLGYNEPLAQAGALIIRAYGLLILLLGGVHFVLGRRMALAGPGEAGEGLRE